MNKYENLEIIFLRVTDNSTKIRRIVDTVHQHFLSGDRLIVFAPSSQAAEYINSLLWKLPPEGFIPHKVADESCNERVIITQTPNNLNNAKIALNLTSQVCSNLEGFEKIYELWDQTDGTRAKQSNDKMQQYKSLGINL